MPLAKVYRNEKVSVTLESVYRDRVSKPSDIQDYLPLLHDTARSYRDVRVLELGTRTGNSTIAFLLAAQEVNGHVWSGDIDNVILHPDVRPLARLPQWTFVQGDDLDPEIISKFPEQVDVLFVDSNHEYEHVIKELHAYMPKLAPGGTALFHDTNLSRWPGYDPPGDIPPVQQALNEYCEEKGLSWENIPGRYGMGLIKT